jgi:predicted unusual protein kinase regulating ubiquinone biosynthesis (AarF/ABC1/UbiB family)
LILPRIFLGNLSRRNRPQRLQNFAATFRKLAVSMGGVLIKVGQFLSTRADVLPYEITSELAGLQDEVPPAAFNEIRALAEAEFGVALNEKFQTFQTEPLAAASLGQVHLARLHTEDVRTGIGPSADVVVKVLRPGIEAVIETDLAALRTIGGWLRRYRPIGRRVDILALVAEFTRTLQEEVDYLAEGRNAETFATNFRGHPGVRVPGVIWSHTTRRVLTLENVGAIKIGDYAALDAAGIDRAEVAVRLLDTYMKQIFEDGFFHADPHPGNLFVAPNPVLKTDETQDPGVVAGATARWQLTFVDFGMVGRVPANLRAGLRELLVGVGLRDPGRVVRSYETLGMLLPGADLELLEKAEARIFERFWGKTMSELRDTSPQEVGEFAREFRQILYTLPFQLPHDLVMLARAVSILSGMCTGLDPNFNVWAHVAPFAQKMVIQEARSSGGLLEEAGNLARALVAVPFKLDTLLQKMERGEIAVRSPEITRQVGRLEGALHQVAAAIFFAAFLLGGIQLFVAGQDPYGWAALTGAGASLFWAIRSGRSNLGK